MKALLIGLGQLGAPIASRLTASPIALSAVDFAPAADFLRRNALSGLDLQVFDVADDERLGLLLRQTRPDAVIYSSGLLGAPSERDPARAFEQNTRLPQRVASRARSEGVRHFVYLSSFAVYGRPDTPVMREDMPCAPVTAYGKSKREGEIALETLASDGFRVTLLRIAGAYGPSPRAPVSLSSRYLHHIMTVAESGRPVGLDGTKPSIDEFVFAADVAEAVKRACLSRFKIPEPVFIANVGPGVRTTPADLREAVVANWPRAVFASEPLWPDFTPLPPLDVTRMRDAFGFEAGIGLAEGLTAWRRSMPDREHRHVVA